LESASCTVDSTDIDVCSLVEVWKMNQVYAIADRLRQEPFNTITNNCIIKSLRFKRECKRIGVDAYVVIAVGIVRLERFNLSLKLLFAHGWAEVNGRRIEVARPLNQKSPWGTFDIDFKPLVAVWI